MTTPEFIEWLEQKLEEHGVGKGIPTRDVLIQTFEESAELAIPKAQCSDRSPCKDFPVKTSRKMDCTSTDSLNACPEELSVSPRLDYN